MDRLHRRRRGLGRGGACGAADRGPAHQRAAARGRPRQPHLSRLPVSFGLLIHDPCANWLYKSDPEPGTANRAIPVPRGKLLGGSSAINGLVWVRGQPLDYDTWAQMGAAAGAGRTWRRCSRIEDFETRRQHSRGNGGPLHVSIVPDQNPLYDALFKAARAGLQGKPRLQQRGPGRHLQDPGQHQARPAHERVALLSGPGATRPNLNIVTEAPARRVLLEGRRCVGVVYEHGGKS